MRMIKAAGLAALLSLGLSSIAAAAPGYATGNVNLRAGPGTEYPVVVTLGAGTGLEIYGCLSGYSWCDVNWRGYRGWVSSNYLEAAYQDRRVYVREVAPPIISFSFGSYWDDHYRGRSWYRDRDRYDRREVRQERREDRREVRQDRREDRREVRQERREDRREARRDRRQDRREIVRQDRREDRREVRRDDRRENRRGNNRDCGPNQNCS
jgi:uncharacterized protein YraI